MSGHQVLQMVDETQPKVDPQTRICGIQGRVRPFPWNAAYALVTGIRLDQGKDPSQFGSIAQNNVLGTLHSHLPSLLGNSHSGPLSLA